jgi:hypothetical protein
MKERFMTLSVIFILSWLITSPLHAQEIKINKGLYADYYHMAYTLELGKYAINSDYGFKKGGEFEVLVPKEYFPIPGPHCKKGIAIRMPSSNNEEKKRRLYDLLNAQETVDVVLELNPHFVGVGTDPLQLKLIFCQVFFRHKLNDYYDHL